MANVKLAARMLHFADDGVAAIFASYFGSEKLQSLRKRLVHPPRDTTLRVLRKDLDVVPLLVDNLESVHRQSSSSHLNCGFGVRMHAVLRDCIVVERSKEHSAVFPEPVEQEVGSQHTCLPKKS